jgi:predicted O-methyltransferase YrrM
MNWTTNFKISLNKLLAPFNLRIETLTAERVEATRLQKLEAAGHFELPVFPLLEEFKNCDPSAIFAEVVKHERRFTDFSAATKGGELFSLDNEYFSSPDAEVLYAIVQVFKPQRIIEVGSGNSTVLFRHAISDANLGARLISVDPHPRREIALYSDEVIVRRVEDIHEMNRFSDLMKNDILFIDSSHMVKPGNDVLFLFLEVLPKLKSGVIIHIHDIFLPFEYPRYWLMTEKRDWSEQFLVQAMLQESSSFQVLWPGHYLQRCQSSFNTRFAHWRGKDAASLWLRKR